METLRLRRMQAPARIETLLEAFVSRAQVVPQDSYQLRDPRSLTKALQAVVASAIEQGQVWSCWARSDQIWLFTCDMSLPLSRERGTPVLLVRLYGEDAQIKDSGTWRCDPLGTWTRCAD